MPDISERQVAVGDHNVVAPVQTPTAHFPPTTPMEPTGSGFTRCPMPPIWSSNPDSLRQFYRSGMVPQIRIYSQSISK